MSMLLEKALEEVVVPPQDEQDAIASQILASLADEDAWKSRFAGKRDVIRRMAREALEEDERGETLPFGRSALMQSRTTRRFWRLFPEQSAHPGLQFKKLEGEDDLIRFAPVWNIALWPS
jgi:restriction endonuclease Mrr